MKKRSQPRDTIKPKKIKAPEFKITESLNDFHQIISQGKERVSTETSKVESHQPVYNATIEIDHALLIEYIHMYAKEMREQHKMNLATALVEAQHELDHNKWMCNANNELQKKLINQDKEILAFLRDKLSTPELYLELDILDNPVQNNNNQPYTPEEKLKAMMSKNPALKKLQKLFNTRIIYK